MYCNKCKEARGVGEDEKYCYECGSVMDNLSRCEGCKHELLPFEKWCPRCGVKNNHPQNGSK